MHIVAEPAGNNDHLLRERVVKLPVTAFAGREFKPRLFKVLDELANLPWHGVVVSKRYYRARTKDRPRCRVVAYLELAEVQAHNRQPMYMRDWLAKLDDFLRLGGRDILQHAGKIFHEQAVEKAELEFGEFHRPQLALPSQVEQDFDAAVEKLKKLPGTGRKKKKP